MSGWSMGEFLFTYFGLFSIGLLLLAWHAHRTTVKRLKRRLKFARELLTTLRGKRELSEAEYKDMHRLYRKILDVPGRISDREYSLFCKILKLIDKKGGILPSQSAIQNLDS
jgi:hypothetical protein